MNIGILAFSARGADLAERIKRGLQNDTISTSRCESGGLHSWTEEHFHKEDALIFVSSCGIAVRAVAPFIQSKVSDPAVVVVDEKGGFSIALLSGHLGGANALAQRVGASIGARPVITTATDVNGLFAVDVWAKQQGMTICNPAGIKKVSSKLVAGETVLVRSDFPVVGKLPGGLVLTDGECDMEITWNPRGDCLHLIPRALTLGVGCKKGTPESEIKAALDRLPIHPAAISKVCSIDLKAAEPGLLAFCQSLGVPLVTYTAEELSKVPGAYTSSSFVRAVTGVDNVCERSAVKGSGGMLLIPKTAANGVTMAVALEDYTVNMEG